MKRVYDFQLRVLVRPRGRGFCAEALEIEGSMTAPTRLEALKGFVCGVQSILCVGEPIYRECPPDLLLRWENVPDGGGGDSFSESAFVVSIAATCPDARTTVD